MTEEQQLWYSDILKLQSMLNHDSFRTIKIAACRKHINKMQQAITAIRNLDPVAESGIAQTSAQSLNPRLQATLGGSRPAEV